MKKILLFIALLAGLSYGANITWLGTSASAKTAANWDGGVLPATGDVWVLSSTNNLALTVDSAFTNAGIAVDAGYTATVSLQSYTVTSTGNVNLGGATLAGGTSTLSLTGAGAQTITSAGEVWYDITINRATAGTCLFADATSCHTITASATNTQVISWTGTTMTCSGNMTFDGTGTHVFGNGITMTGASSNLHIGSTLTAPTATSCAVTFNGTTACVLDDDKGTTFMTLTLGASAIVTCTGAGAASFYSATTPFVLGASATLTNNGDLRFGLSGATSFYSLGAGYTLDGSGAGAYRFYITVNSITVTCPAITISGTISIFLFSETPSSNITGSTFSMTGALVIPTTTPFYLAVARVASQIIQDMNGQNITCGQMLTGCIAGAFTTGSQTLKFGSGTHSIASYNGTTYNVASAIQFGTSIISCSGNWAFGSNNVITGTAASQSVTITNTSAVTNAGKTFPGSFIVNAPAKVVTMTGKFRCGKDFTVTAGGVVFGNLAIDSIAGDYANNGVSTDSVNWNADSCWFAQSFTGNLRTKNDLARKYLYGTALCNFTTNTAKINHIDVRGDTRAKQMKLIDRHTIRKLQVTTGTLNTNSMDCFADSFIVVQDSVATVLGDTISAPKITFGATAKPIIGTPMLLYFGLALADTMRDSIAQSLGKLVVNKTGSNLTFASVGHYDTIQIINGSIAMNAATDTQYCAGLSITSTSACVLTAPINCSGTLHTGSTSLVTATGAPFIMSSATTGLIDCDADITIPALVISNGGTITNDGAGYFYIKGTAPLTFTNGGTLTVSSNIKTWLTGTGNIITVTAGSPTINGNANVWYKFDVAAEATGTIPAIAIGGLGQHVFQGDEDGSDSVTWEQAGNITVTGAESVRFNNADGGDMVYNSNDYSITGTSIANGRSALTGTLRCNFGASENSVTTVNNGIYNQGAIYNYGTSRWTVTANWTNGSTDSITGTPLVTFSGAAAQVYTAQGKKISRVTVNKSANGLKQTGHAHYDTLRIIDGTFSFNAATDTAICNVFIDSSTDASTFIAPIIADKIIIASGANITFTGVGKIVSTACTAATLNGNAVRIYYPTISPISYADAPWTDTVTKTSTHDATFGGCTLGRDSVVAITPLPTGFSITKTGTNAGRISWDGTGTPAASANYVIRAYGNAKTDSASVTVGIVIAAAPSTGREKRHGGSLSTSSGLIIGTE